MTDTRQPIEDPDANDSETATRRQFLKKLSYAAPAILSYQVGVDEAEAKDKKKKKKKKKTSPDPDAHPIPPPPPNDDDD